MVWRLSGGNMKSKVTKSAHVSFYHYITYDLGIYYIQSLYWGLGFLYITFGDFNSLTISMTSSASSNTSCSLASQKLPIICKCRFECPMWTSQKPHSRGKRFFGCPFYNVREKSCGFFTWYDDIDQSLRTDEMMYRVAALEARLALWRRWRLEIWNSS